MDDYIEFVDLTRGGIIPRIAPLVSVVYLSAGTVTFTPPNPSLSAGYDGATIASYEFSAPGANTTSNMTSATTASWTYNAAGEYRWSCSITDSLGRVTTSYRWVFVNPSDVDFVLSSAPVGDWDAGGWSFGVTVFDDVTKAEIYDRALVTLYAKDYYNGSGTASSIGKLTGYENIIVSGWVDGESIQYDSEKGSVSFAVYSAEHWFEKIHALPFELQDSATAATDWKHINEMTVDKALAQILYWTSTAPLVMDCFFSGNTDRLPLLAQPGGTLLDQLNSIALTTIFARPLVNSYGQMYIEVDTQIISDTVRDTLPVVMDITTADYEAPLEIERSTSSRVSMIELAAQADYDGTNTVMIYSRAPGNTLNNGTDGINYRPNRMQPHWGLANANNEYEPLDISFAANIRLFDIAPAMYATITISAASNPRGIALTAARLIPRRVSYSFDDNTGELRTNATFEVETIGVDGVEYNPPTLSDDNVDMSIDIGGVDFPGLDDWFPNLPPEVTTPCSSFVHNSFTLTWSPNVITGAGPLISKAYFPCMLRATGSSIIIPIVFYADAAAHFAVYGIKDGARVITGTLTVGRPTVVNFTPASNLQVDGFEIEIDELLTGTIWDQTAGIDPFSGTDAYNLLVIENYPTAKQVHFKVTQPLHTPYTHQMVGTIVLDTPAVGDVSARLTYSIIFLDNPEDTTTPTFTITGVDVTASSVSTAEYGGSDLGAANVLYEGSVGSGIFFTFEFTPNVYGVRAYEIWVTIHDTATDRAIHLSNSTLYDVCAI
jgi:hypothetical protein